MTKIEQLAAEALADDKRATPDLKYHADLAWLSGRDPDGEIYTVASFDLDSRDDGKCFNHKANSARFVNASTREPILAAYVAKVAPLIEQLRVASVTWPDGESLRLAIAGLIEETP